MKFWKICIILVFFLAIPVQASILDGQVGLGGQGGSDIKDQFTSQQSESDIRAMIVDIIKYILTFLALFFTILVIWGGFKWMKAGGNEQELAGAKKTVVTAVIGMVIILCAYAITVFVSEFTYNALNQW